MGLMATVYPADEKRGTPAWVRVWTTPAGIPWEIDDPERLRAWAGTLNSAADALERIQAEDR